MLVRATEEQHYSNVLNAPGYNVWVSSLILPNISIGTYLSNQSNAHYHGSPSYVLKLTNPNHNSNIGLKNTAAIIRNVMEDGDKD